MVEEHEEGLLHIYTDIIQPIVMSLNELFEAIVSDVPFLCVVIVFAVDSAIVTVVGPEVKKVKQKVKNKALYISI